MTEQATLNLGIEHPLEQYLKTQPAAPAKLDYDNLTGEEPFPQFAKASDPAIVGRYKQAKASFNDWGKWLFRLLEDATGTQGLRRLYSQGTSLNLTLVGVYSADVAETHIKHWKRSRQLGVLTWKKAHPLAEALDSAQFKTGTYAGEPAAIIRDAGHSFMTEIGEPTYFLHEGELYLRYPFTPTAPGAYNPETSPWQPIEEWEYIKARTAKEQAEQQQA